MSYLTIFDIAMISIIVISTILGTYRGFVNITINLIGFITSIIFAILLYKYIFTDLFVEYIHNEAIKNVAAGTVSYVISLIFCSYIFTKLMNLVGGNKGVVDKVFGFWLGFIRGILLVLIIFWVIVIFANGKYINAKNADDLFDDFENSKNPMWMQDMYIKKYLDDVTENIIKLLPDGTLKSIILPKFSDNEPDANEAQEDIIDSINKKKGNVKSSISKPISKDVEEDLTKALQAED